MHKSYALAVVAAMALAGCASVPLMHAPTAKADPGQPHAPDSTVDAASVVRSIRLCRTQLAELRQQLGEPTRDGLMHKQRIVSWTVHWDAPKRSLAVLLNAQETVVDIYWNVSSEEVPWSPTDQCLVP